MNCWEEFGHWKVGCHHFKGPDTKKMTLETVEALTGNAPHEAWDEYEVNCNIDGVVMVCSVESQLRGVGVRGRNRRV